MKCPSCNKNIPDGSRYCLHCGQQIEEHKETMQCPQCHKCVPADSRFCPFCGHNLSVRKRGSYIVIETTNSDCYIESRYGECQKELTQGVNEISVVSCPWIYKGVIFHGKRISTDYWNLNTYGISQIDLSYYDTSNIVDMSRMFNSCTSLERLDWNNINTSKVTDMSVMFQSCSSLKFIDLSKFDTSQVENMQHMFFHCNSLESLDLSRFNTCKVKNMAYMFAGCSLLGSLDLSGFDTRKVEDMEGMFRDCSLLESLNLSNFEIKESWSDCRTRDMFLGCGSLKTLILKNCNKETVKRIEEEIKDAGISPEIFTSYNRGDEGHNNVGDENNNDSGYGSYQINEDCFGCGACLDVCPSGAISEGSPYYIDPDICVCCGTCLDECPSGCIHVCEGNTKW